MTRKLFLAFLLSLFTALSFAQEKYSVKIALQDSLTKGPVSYAAVYISKDGKPNNAYYAMVNDKGEGVITGIPKPGKYFLVANMIGYKPVTRAVNVDKKVTDAGVFIMHPDVTLMESVVVSAVGNAIVAKQDTIEYNAEAFKVAASDMLEDLLKKLPGIEVDADGKITAHGEVINKIMIDGKEFFLDDPKIASKNIPAHIVQKVKVLEKKSKQAEFTGIDDGQEKTIIDLKVKPGMMNTWFGNLNAGGGMDITDPNHNGRYQASGMIGHFSDKLQVGILGNGNNTNNRGFQSFGGGGNSGGILSSWMGGANVNYSFDRNRTLGANYMYNGSDRINKGNSQRTTFLDDDQSLLTKKQNNGHSFSDGHRGGLVLDYKFNDKASIYFQPQFNYGRNESNRTNEYSTENSLLGKVNDGHSQTRSEGTSWSTSGSLLYRQKIGSKPGRTLSVNANFSLSSSKDDGINRSTTNNYFRDELANTKIIDQYNRQKSERYSAGGNLTYTEPLGKNFYLLGSYRFNWSESLSEKLTYDTETHLLDSVYSNSMNNTYMNHRMQISLRKQEKKYNFQIGFNAEPSTTKTVTKIGSRRDTTYSVWNFAPSARFDYRFSKTHSIRVNYNGNTSQPSINQLMPAPNNSDPLYVSLGNPSLKPAFRHNFKLDYRYTDMNTFSTYSLRGGFNYTKDALVNAQWYDGRGVQYSAPINSREPVLGGNLSLMINAQIGKSGFSISSTTRGNVSSGLSYTGTDTTAHTLDEIMGNLQAGRTTSLSATENIAFKYRNDYIDTRIGFRATYKNAWYEISNRKRAQTWDNRVYGQVTATFPWKMEIRTDISYNFYFGYDEGYGDNTVMWNAEIFQPFLKSRLTLNLKVYDILNQAKSVSRTTTDNFVEDRYNNTLGQYFMVSLIYRFGNRPSYGNMNRRGGGKGYSRGSYGGGMGGRR